MALQIKSQEAYDKAYKESVESPEVFWGNIAENFQWRKNWDKVLDYDWEEARFEWFKGGKLNITENCLDRHLETRGNQTAIIWEPNDPNDAVKTYTYKELHAAVSKTANALKANGIKKGDRVCFYMPMVPELAIGVLACARIGAVHSVVFAGFSASALASRINDATCKMVICTDYNKRGTKNIPVKSVVDEALALGCESIETVLVHKNTGDDVNWHTDLDKWWHEEVEHQSADCPATEMDAEDMLFILYTSGSTGQPKGMVHTCGGYMVNTAYTFLNVMQYEENDVYWCTADIGWITGHSYIVYGPLAAGATTVMFEGVPTFPDAGRFWEVVAKHRVNQFYTAPTAIRALMKSPLELVEKHDLSSLKVLGTVGEPINQEAWDWYNVNIGKEKCPIVDTWWQTETGGMMLSNMAGVTPQKPTFATLPQIGIQPALYDEQGNEVKGNPAEGRLAIKYPWPSMARTIYGNHQRYKETYFSTYKDNYFTGDGALRDENGFYRITGRVDDVVIVSGHNLGTAPIEDAINAHEAVVESALVGYPHDIKGNALYGYIILHEGVEANDDLRIEINNMIAKNVGAIAKLNKIQFVPGLPKTRSGKIMRRILRKVASNELDNMGDISTLLNPEIVELIIKERV